MRYFKIVLACFGFILAVVGITAGVLFLTGKFDKEVVQPGDIAFEITEKLTEDDFEVVVNTTTENVTEKDVTLSLTNQTEADGMISDGVITVPKVVKLGKPFTVKVNKTHYAGMTEEWNVGGTSIIRAKSTNPLIQEATPLTVEVDVPVHSLGVELVTTTGTKIGTVSARNLKNYMKTLAEGEEDKKVVELAVGSVVRLQPVFTPAKSAKTTKGEPRKVLFEIPTAWKGIHIDFVDGENDLIEVLRQTTVEDIKINAYCFRTSADEYVAQSKGYSDEELITMMNSNGISGASSQIFGTNQKITSFTSSTNDEYMNLAINSPMTLVANGKVDNAFDLGLGLASDAGVAKLEDKIAVIKLFAYWQNGDGAWEDAGDKLEIVGQTSSKKENGVKAKINKNDANFSSWKVIASETGKYKIVAKLSYEYYSSSSSVPTEINFEIPFNNILVADPISSDVAWKSTLPAIKTLVVLDGETAAEKYYPTINLADFVDIKNPNATYKVVRFFAYSTEGENLANVINCSLYSGNFAVPDSSNQYEVFEIPNGILTAKDVGNFRIFFATVVSDYMGNPKIQFGGYLFESFSNTNTINVVKSLKQLDASMTVNQQEDGKDYNKNTDETTRDYIFHVRQQDEKVFTLSLFVSDIEIFERDYADGKISIDFLLDGQKSKILELTGDYVIDIESKRIDFQVSVKSLPNNDQPTLECKVTYDLDHRLDKFVSNNGNKVQIKVLNGFAQEIVFDAVKDANPRNSAENPIQVEIKFNAGSDNVATNVEYGITLNEQKLILEDLSKVTINEEALNKTYTLSSNKPAVIAVEDDPEKGPKLSILGATEDEDVIITATAADGSGLTANLYFRVLASLQITLTPNKSEITMDGYQGNQMNFRTYFDAKAGDIDLNNLLEYNVPIDNTSKFAFADDTLKIVSTLGRDASLQLYITSDFGFTKIVPIRIVSNISASSTYAFNDQGLDDSDFVARGETPPTERGTRVYAENSREISFVLTQEEPTPTNIAISVDDFELPKNGGVQNISYNNGILTVCFDAVSQMTEKTIIFKKNFSENDEYAFVYTMKFLVFPNIKASLVSNVGSEENPANYVSGATVIYDAKDNSNGLIKLERILGSSIISEHATLEARINGEWVALSSNSGVFTLPTSFRATEGSFVEIRITYDGCVLSPVKLFFKPFFDESILLDAKVLYGGKLYVPFIANGENSITLNQAEGVVYTIINATSEQYLRIRGNQIEKLDRLYTKIITSEKLRIENGNGATELPIIILPLKYPFVVYNSIENAESEETYRTVDLKQVIESESFYDTLEAGSDETIDLKSKILVDGLESGGALVSVINADGSANNYVNYDAQNLTISANSVGKDQIVYVKVKCGAEFEEAFEFVYRIKINANQQIKVFYPYIEYNEEYNVENAYEYLYFGSKNQISVDLMEEFDSNKTPNKNLLEELFPTTNGQTYARRFVVVREKDGKLIPIEYKDLHFEIASVGIGKAVIPADQVSNYVTINEKTTTNGVLQSANMFVNRGQSVETINIRIRAYTSSGAEAYYRFQVNDKPISYSTYYKGQKIRSDEFSVASDGKADINLNENVVVKVGENPEQPVSPNNYKFYLIVHEKLGTDYSQFISLSGGHIQISTLVNDVETTIIIYDKTGEISRFNLILKCTIDHEVISTTIGADGVFDIGKNVNFFNATSADGNYSMQEISTRLYVRNYLNGTDIGSTSAHNLFVNVGGYSIKDISKNYKQYVLIDNLKVYAENLMDTWKGQFYLGDNARYDVMQEGKKKYIRYNGSIIEVKESIVNIPLQSTTDSDTVAYKVETRNGTECVIIPHLKFANGNDTRDYVLYDRVFHEEKTDPAEKYTNEPFDINRKGNYTTYVNAYVNGYIRYKVDRGVDSNGETKLKVAILRLTHNNVSYIAQVDEDHYDHEYVEIRETKEVDGVTTTETKKHYFTRFYTITYDGIAKDEKDDQGKDVRNVPRVRYMFKKGETTIDLSKIIFYTQEGISNNVLKLGGTNYISNMFKFYVDDGSEESREVEFEQEPDENGNQINTWLMKLGGENKYSPIDLVIKDTTGKFVVGRLKILPTVETSTSETESNQTIFIKAGDTTKVDYAIKTGTIQVSSYAGAMSKKDGENQFTGTIEKDHPGWTNYVYAVSSNKYTNLLSIDDNRLSIDGNGQISGLSGQAPWGDVTVEARLMYSSSNTSLTTTLPFETWKNAILGTTYSNYVNSYAELKILLGDNYRIVTSSGSVNDTTGDITDVAYGETITISLEANCSTCNKWAVVGTEHKHWSNDGTEEIIDNISKVTDEQILQSLKNDGSFEKIDEGKKYVYVLPAGSILEYSTDENGENGQWKLTGIITKTTYVEETVKLEFRKSIQNPITGEDVELTITDGEQTVKTNRLDLSSGGYATLATALFGKGPDQKDITTILGYKNWKALLDDCNVVFAGYDNNTKTFGEQKEINITLTTTQAKRTGTFYIVNQEHENKTIHGVGNLKKIDESLNDYTAAKEIASVVNVGDYWVYPMATTKTLKSDAILIGDVNNGKTLEKLIADWWFGGSMENQREISYTGITRDLKDISLSSAAGLKNASDPFNTITICQNDYAIGNLHIYLEDYSGDDTASNWKIYTSSEEDTGSENAWSRVIETNNGSKIRFVIGINGCLTTTLKTSDVQIIYITQNAAMNGNKYLFSNGLLLEWNGTNIALSMINKESKIEFAFNGVTFKIVKLNNNDNKFTSSAVYHKQDGEQIPTIHYFEGLEDATLQPENSKFENGGKTYKAEMTSGDDISEVVYKDKIEKDMFNFDQWEYSATYVNESGQTVQASVNGEKLKVNGLNDKDKQIKITVSGITDIDGYTFVVDLNQTPAVTVVEGKEYVTSPDTPYDGGVITSGQEKVVDLNDIFKINANEGPVIIDNYASDKTDADSLVKALFEREYFYYLVGTYKNQGTTLSGSNFKITRSDDGTKTISIIFEQSNEEYIISYNDSENKFVLDEDPDGEFTLALNTEMYEFKPDIVPGSETEEGAQSKKLQITITPVFTYKYEVKSNIKLIDINEEVDSKNDENESKDFAESGKLTVTGKEITSESVVKFRFSVLRGKGKNAKELAFAYYSLSLKPCVGAVITYPTISTSTKDENGNFVAVGQTTEYFYYAGAGEFDINAKSAISTGTEQRRMEIIKYFYGTATTIENEKSISYPCVATYNGSKYILIKIGDNKKSIELNNMPDSHVLTETITDNEKKYVISVYVLENFTISYTASSSQNIIKGKDKENNDILTNSLESKGKFTFDMTGVTVSEAEVVVSAQATVTLGNAKDGVDPKLYTFTFAQYTFTVCKNPVISAYITTEDGHLDENGAEILPINGGADIIKPFDTKKDGNIIVGEGENQTTTPRLQFVYNNLILSSRYEDNFGIKGKTTKIRDYSISQTATAASTVYFVYKDQDVSGSYSYKTVWDYKINPTLDSHTIMGNYDPKNTSELLNYYYLDAGKDYNIVKTFGITRYFGGEFTTNIIGLNFVGKDGNYNEETETSKYSNVQLSADGQSINVLGAPEGGMNFRIQFQPYNNAALEIIGITITSTLEFNVNYRNGTSYGDNNAYGLILYEDIYDADKNEIKPYSLVENKKGLDFTIERNGVVASITERDFPMSIVKEETDESLGVEIVQDNQTATLTIKNPPILNSKRVVIKITDTYGYVQYLRFVIGAKTQVEVSTNDIIFTTGDTIAWDDETSFPISFKKSGEETIQLASFYESTKTIPGATNNNTEDSYGNDSSLKIENNKLYGVQLNAIITKYTSDDKSAIDKFYVPYAEVAASTIRPISYDVYKLAARKDNASVTLKSFDKYSKIEISYKTGATTTKLTWTKGESTPSGWPLNETGALTKVQEEYEYTIKIYSGSSLEGIITFTTLKVMKTENLYYALRTNAKDCYTFDYGITIDGTNIVTDKKIGDVGNAQYGSTSSIDTTLTIGVYSSYTDVNTTDNTFKIGETTYIISYNSDGALDNISDTEGTTEVNLEINKNTVTIGGIKYQLIKGEDGKTVIKIAKFVDNVDLAILLRFRIYPRVEQTSTTFDYVGLGDKVIDVLNSKSSKIQLCERNSTGELQVETKQYSTVLGSVEFDNTETFKAMGTGSLENTQYAYRDRVLSLIERLTSDPTESTIKTATINNILYTYDSANTLKIGYKEVDLDANNTYVDDVTGITYKVKEDKLYVSKKVDNAGKVTINNIKYSVSTTSGESNVNYETLYESIFVVWEYDHDNNSATSPLIYWAQWNYKVVDKFNEVTTDSRFEAQNGIIKVKFDWTSKVGNTEYRFNPNTLKLCKTTNGKGTSLGEAKWVSDTSGSRYEIVIEKETYIIVRNNDDMKFLKKGTSNNYYQSLALSEETMKNSSWADGVRLTGLDGSEMALSEIVNNSVQKDAIEIALKGADGIAAIDRIDKVTINANTGLSLDGKTLTLQIQCTRTIDGNAKDLLLNGNEIKVQFEHFTIPTNA